jgi:hypothetical protein
MMPFSLFEDLLSLKENLMNWFRRKPCLLAALVVLAGIISGTAAQAEKPDWVLVTPSAQWKPRDSQGELVFQDQLWIFGGWHDSFSPAPRDVWSSSDGVNWNLVEETAPWKHSDLPMTIVFKDRMWIMGGWYNGRLPDRSPSNEVWSSIDGKNWTQETAHAGWSARLGAGLVEFKGKLWILGGCEDYFFGDATSLKNDVWSSEDGKTWKLETAQAEWAPRAFHQAAVLNGRIYVLGGGNYLPEYAAYNDVWSSADGVHWEQETAHAPWHERIWFSTVVYRDHLWVMGGWSNNPYKNWGDVWYSRDGKEWKELKTDHCWRERHELSAFVFQDKIWVAGGLVPPLTNDVWSLQLPRDWSGESSSD